MDNRRSDDEDGRYDRSRNDDMSTQSDEWDDEEDDYASDGGKSLLLWIGGGVLALVIVAFLVFFGRGSGGSSSGGEAPEEMKKLQARVEQLETDARSRQEIIDRLNTDQAAFQEEWIKMVTKVEDLRKTVADLSQKSGAPQKAGENVVPLLPPPAAETSPAAEVTQPVTTVDDQAAAAQAEAEAEKKREAARKKAEAKKEAARKKAEAEKAAAEKATAEKESPEKPKKKTETKEPEKSVSEKETAEKPKKTPIPKEGYITIEPGQNLFRISQRYGISQDELKRLNRMESDQVNIGQKIYLKQK